MGRLVNRIRLAIGSRLVGLGFLIAPDAYWTAFEGKIRSARLKEPRDE
jgi:hypothetical protein